jgi:hypothetical protein
MASLRQSSACDIVDDDDDDNCKMDDENPFKAFAMVLTEHCAKVDGIWVKTFVALVKTAPMLLLTGSSAASCL